MAEEDSKQTSAEAGAEKTATAQPSAVDVQAQIDAALAEQSAKQAAQHKAELKEATGYETVAELREAQQIEQGNAKDALAEKSSKLAAAEKRFQDSQIQNALLTAANESVDPATVVSLLAGQCQCDEAGVVTVDGKPVADAVAALLAAKPFLAKAQGDTGSGAPQTTQGKKSMARSAFDALSATDKSKFVSDGGIVTE